MEIRYVQVLSVKKLNPVLVIREVDRGVEKVLYPILRRVPAKYSTKYITSRAVLRK